MNKTRKLLRIKVDKVTNSGFKSRKNVQFQLHETAIETSIDNFCLKDHSYLHLTIHDESSDALLVSIPGETDGPNLHWIPKGELLWFYQINQSNLN